LWSSKPKKLQLLCTGDPLHAVDPSDLKAAWGICQDLEESRPEGRVAVSTSVIEQACSPESDIRAPGGLLGPWQRGEQLSEGVFKVAARTSMEWLETGAPRQGFRFDVDGLLRDGTSAANEGYRVFFVY